MKYQVFGYVLILLVCVALFSYDESGGNRILLWPLKRQTEARTPQASVRIGGVTVQSSVARTVAERSRGLAGRTRMAEDEGMLFVFDQRGLYQFWMQGMLFPLDIIWIENGRVVDLMRGAPVPSSSADVPVYTPQRSASYVLEVHAGFSERHGINIGSPVALRIDAYE